MKTYDQINDRISSGTVVVLTADEIADYVDKKGVSAVAEEVDVVSTATFGPMCSSGAVLEAGADSPVGRFGLSFPHDRYPGLESLSPRPRSEHKVN